MWEPFTRGQQLLAPKSARRVKRLVKFVKKMAWGNPRGQLDQWLSNRLEQDREAIAFIEMLLAGETCAPANHITARYGLECLSSLYDDWYSIRGGSQKLVEALRENSGARIVPNAHVREVKEVRGGVHVTWTEGRERKSEKFGAAIIATPGGELLVGKPVRTHFHSYVSVLLEYEHRPSVKADPRFGLSNGLYTDGPLNYIQMAKQADTLYVLCILIPNAESSPRLKKQELVECCVQYLDPIIEGADQSIASSVQRWEYGLPCGGHKQRRFQRVGRRIFLAGDRFGRWPSMDAAVSSGFVVGKALTRKL